MDTVFDWDTTKQFGDAPNTFEVCNHQEELFGVRISVERFTDKCYSNHPRYEFTNIFLSFRLGRKTAWNRLEYKLKAWFSDAPWDRKEAEELYNTLLEVTPRITQHHPKRGIKCINKCFHN